jgi:hypothetical protein
VPKQRNIQEDEEDEVEGNWDTQSVWDKLDDELGSEARAVSCVASQPQSDCARTAIDGMLNDLRDGKLPEIPSCSQYAGTRAAALLKDLPKVRQARARLAILSKDKNIDVFFRVRLTAMQGALNIFFEPKAKCTWTQASVIAAQAQGRGQHNHARNICRWCLSLIEDPDNLPLHRYCKTRPSVLDDEDISVEIQRHLLEMRQQRPITAKDVCNIITSLEMQVLLKECGVLKTSISKRAACEWLEKLSWQYGVQRKGMYINGHERGDVVAYRKEFIERWKQYERRFHLFDNDGNPLPPPTGFVLPPSINANHRFRLILVTHDESTFFQNDKRKNVWAPKDELAPPKPKGDGQSLMVSDFLTAEWGRLKDENEYVVHGH